MTTMNAELYDALIAGGTPDDKARKAAEALAAGDTKHSDLLRGFERLEGKFGALEAKFSALEGRTNVLLWLIGLNITMTLFVLGRLFVLPR